MSDAVAVLAVAAAAGVAGSVHCVAMCGGIATLGAIPGASAPPRPVRTAVLFHGGRVLSYSLIGGLLALGARGLSSAVPAALEGTGRILAAVLMAALALRILLNRDVLGTERVGAGLFRGLMPLWRQLLRVPGALRQLALGTVWGLMPCGLAYSMLAVAAASREPLLAMAGMAAFGLGTIPGLFAFTVGAGRLRSVLATSRRARTGSGALILTCALWTGAGALMHVSHRTLGHPGHADRSPVPHAAFRP